MIMLEKQIFLDFFLSKYENLTSESEYDECIRMNETFKNISSTFFREIGYTQYFLTVLT